MKQNKTRNKITCRSSIDVGAGLVSARGITLIALVITIIILLILAGVVINLVIGENGILNKAKEAGREYQNAADYERTLLEDTTNIVNNIMNGVDEDITGETGGETGGETETPPTPPTTLTPSEIEPTVETHTPTKIQYSWEDIAGIAKIISDNSATITNDTEEVTVKTSENSYTLGVGDTAKVDEKTVRIIGFNHDELANRSIYGGTNTYAGISFEYVDFITSAQMNNTDTNSDGWGACELRTTLNSTTLESISIKNYIKEVKKEYIATYNDPESKTTSQDKLWLLSCGEIWANGYGTSGGNTRGYAIATEGSQYRYYNNLSPVFWGNDTLLNKSSYWWLRSPSYCTDNEFCIQGDGTCYYDTCRATNSYGVAPGFAI